MGATDGHAKNFSLFLHPGGRYQLTPLDDVMSIQPQFDAGQIRVNEKAIQDTLNALPKGFSEQTAIAIFGGYRQRLRQLTP